MNGRLLLKFCFLGFVYAFSINDSSTTSSDQNILVHPEVQVANEYNDVVIDCMERENGKVYWRRPKGFPLPKQAVQKRGRLYIYNITSEEEGYYVCISENKKFRANALVFVIPRATTTGFKWTSSISSSVTYGLPSTPNPLKSSEVITNTPYSCLLGICNGTCCRRDSVEAFFDCANGQKINKSLVCNRENDCDDGSDESSCSPWSPKITVLPKHNVEVYCNDQDKAKSETLILECESAGYPSPLIRWKKYEGHVPSKCQQYSKQGHGILTCPDFQQSDQGAYSCVAENSVEMAESQPKSLAKCSNSVNCRGFRVVNEEQLEHCLECYCSGKTNLCQNIKSNLTISKFPFPESQTEIFYNEDEEILFIPTKTALAPNDKVRKSSREINYCTLSENDFNGITFLKSFGRNLIIPRYEGKSDFLMKAPDLIIRGNGLSLMYTANLIFPSKDNMTYVHLRFWPGNWHHLNRQVATRKDLMKVLSNVDSLFIRCEYEEGKSVNWGNNTTIYLESSVITEFTNSVSYLEKCTCPTGYEGLSCESCASGYKKEHQGNDFICKSSYIPPPPCKEGYKGVNCSECDTQKGYIKNGNSCEKPVCHPDGSVSIFTNFSKNCTCKFGVTGEKCDRCSVGSFYLHKAGGCLKCWCSGVTNQCDSSNLHRMVISKIPRGGYNSSDGRNFWLLPSDFSGNQLASYGGYLNYTMKYKPKIPKENSKLTVEFLSIDDITLIYTFTSVDRSLNADEKSRFVPLTETNWRKSDGSAVSRGEFLWVLSKLKAIYIESPYHLSSGQANLTSTRMSSATPSGDDQTDLALEVEQCNCPKGYTGLSCESCRQGYYKKRNGTIIQCIKCNCSYCDPELGCQDCPQLTYRDNPEEEKIPVCKPCPCTGNGVSCVKDDYNQIFCRCKSGFTGMHCENLIASEKDELIITISPRRVKGKKVGTVVHFNCSLYSNEEMILSTKKRYSSSAHSLQKSVYNDSGISTNQGSKVSKNFEIVLDAGLEFIECFVEDAQGRQAGHVVAAVEDLITFTEPVEITNCHSEKIDVKESENKDIICEAKGSPTPTLSWYKSKNHLLAEKVDTSKGVHTIESASLNDNGTIYTCIAENSEGDKAICTKVLIVRKKCEVINIFPKHIRIEEGKNISIQCKTTAKSPVTWAILDPVLGKEKPISSFKTSVRGSYLEIIDSSVSDSGTYICTAKGENGKINKTISVIVEEKRIPPIVSILEYDKTLKMGEDLEVNCNATGKPVPTIIWTKVNGSLESNVLVAREKLKINKATVKNSGIYECKAQSDSGDASSYISIEVENNFPPKINISSESFKVHEGDEVNVTCLAIGFPRPKINWFAPNINLTKIWRENSDIISNDTMLSTEETLNFRIDKDMDDLIITCSGENSAGRAEVSTKIKVLQTKSGINETVEFVLIGSYFELICDFSGNITWNKLIGKLAGDECPIPNGLMIPSVQNQHNGTYLCKAESESQKIINLIVVGFVPKFSNAARSFLILPVKLMSNNDIRIELSFNSASENGLLLQKGNRKFDVYLEKGKIHLDFFSSEEDFLDIAMNNPIELRRWYSLVVTINANFVDVTIYDEKTMIFERKTERFKGFKINMGSGEDSFFLGGPIRKARHLRGMFFRHFPHFEGCVSRLNIDGREFNIVKEGSYSHNVSLCRRCSEENLCFEKGKCLDAPTQYGFICVCPKDFGRKDATCPASCQGRGCETQLDLCAVLNPCGGFLHKCTNRMYSLECQCAYGYSGTTCEKVQEHSFCVKGTGYVRLPSNLLERHLGVMEIIRMGFTLHKLDGQLLWQGDKVNHLSISVREGKLQYAYLNQNSRLEIHTNKELELNQKYLLSVWRINSTGTLELNRLNQAKQVYRNSTSKVRTNRVIGDIYLGNIPNDTLHIGRHIGLNGCIHYISFGDKEKINLPEVILEELDTFLPKKLYHDSYYDSDESDYNNDVDSDYKN